MKTTFELPDGTVITVHPIPHRNEVILAVAMPGSGPSIGITMPDEHAAAIGMALAGAGTGTES